MKTTITSALLYVNGPVHIGHIRSTYLPADIYSRYLKMKGEDVIFISGSDEHGTPIAMEADRLGLKPSEVSGKYHKKATKSFSGLGIKFDHYSRTGNKINREMTIEFFERLKKNGHIEKRKVFQYFCEKCGKFLPDRYVKGECPKCGAKEQYSDSCDSCGMSFSVGEIKNPFCSSCGGGIEVKESEHHIFRLGAFSKELKRYIEKELDISPELKNHIKNWLKGLKDWDIVRDMGWGIPVPGEKGKVFYVWFDAPIGYISITKEFAEDWEERWKKGRIVHFIGKDIVYHHTLFWPAMLMSAGFGLPSTISVRGYATLEGKKLSKSRKWWILVDDFLEKFDPDFLRYYLTALTPNRPTDADFKWGEFRDSINGELIGSFGNFANRVLTFTHRKFGGKVPEGKKDAKLWKSIGRKLSEIDKEMSAIELKKALDTIMSICDMGNEYFQKNEPWKSEDAGNTIYNCIQLLQKICIVMLPFVPFAAERLAKQMNINDISWKALKKDLPVGHKLGKPEILFRHVEEKDINDFGK